MADRRWAPIAHSHAGGSGMGALTDLSDADDTGKATGSMLYYDGASWVDSAALWTFDGAATVKLSDATQELTLDAGGIVANHHGIWFHQTAETASNYALLGDSSNNTLVNAAGTLYLRQGNSNRVLIGASDVQLATDLVVATGNTFTIYDGTGVDSVSFDHDGADFNATGTTTGNFTLTGFTGDLELGAGMGLKIYDGTNADYLAIDHSGVDINMTNVSTTDWNIIGLTGGVWIRDGAFLKISDTGDTDYAQFSHDGTDFNTTFAATADWNIEDLTQIVMRDGADLLIYGPTNAQYGQFYNDDSSTIINTSSGQVRFNVAGALKMGIAATYNYDYQPRLQLEAANAVADVSGYGQWWVKTETPNDAYFTDDTGVDYPIGYGTYRRTAASTLDHLDVTGETIGAKHIGGLWIKTDTSADSLTLEASSSENFKVGAQLCIVNAGSSGDMTVNDTATQTLYILDGSSVTDVAGSCTIGPGGYATLIRASTTTAYIMGAGIT